MLKELDITTLVCGNCHYEIEYKGETNATKDYLIELGKINRCMACGLKPKSNGVLSYHHRDPKTKLFAISTACYGKYDVSFGRYTEKEVICEVRKCDLLCRNCHEMRHSSLSKFNRLELAIVKRAVGWVEQQEEQLTNPKQRTNPYENKQFKRFDNISDDAEILVEYKDKEDFFERHKLERVGDIRAKTNPFCKADHRSTIDKNRETKDYNLDIYDED